MKFVKKPITIFTLLNIISIALFLRLNEDTDSPYMFMFVISTMQLGYGLYALIKANNPMISLPTAFTALSYVFHFGQLPMLAFTGKIPNGMDANWYVTPKVYFDSFVFSFLVQFVVIFGMLLFFEKYKIEKTEKAKEVDPSYLSKMKIVGYTSIGVGIVPLTFINAVRIYAFITGGYLAVFKIDIPDMVQVIANLCNLGFIILVVAFQNEKKKANIVFAISVFFQVVAMMSGGRGEAMCNMIAIFFVWTYFVYKIGWKQLLVISAIGLVVIFILNFFAKFRVMPLSFANAQKALSKTLENNQITTMLGEFGSTFATVCFTMRTFTMYPQTTYGLNYLLPIIYILPNIGHFNAGVVDLSIYTKHIYTYKQPVGGSYIGELFYSFGWSGILFAILIGFGLGYITYQMYKCKKEGYFIKFVLFAQMISYLLFWVRGYFGALYRGIIWHGCFMLIVWWFVNSKYYSGFIEKFKFRKKAKQ